MNTAITELDYALNCAAVEIDTTNARAELAQLSARAAEADALRAERDELKAALELGQINCDAEYADLRQQLSNECLTAVQLRATVAEQARQIEAARELLDLILKNSREVSEGDCIYCNCEQGGGNEHDCYYDCPMNDVRAWLAANAPTQGETEGD